MKKSFALVIFGPTAVGKTDFSLEIAKQIPAEIINGDSAQFYTPLSVGTAKPDWRNEPVPHHLFDIIDEPRHFSVCEYRERLIAVVNDVYNRGNFPIIVGGSGFYLKSIFFPPLAGCQTTSSFEKKSQKESSLELWKKLNTIDPARASRLNTEDRYRIQRALDIWEKTGKKPSECMPKYNSPFDFSLLYLSRDREELYNRINLRTGMMVNDGWLQEVEGLRGTKWESFLYEKKLIGYDVLLDYLASKKTKQDLDRAVAVIQQRTRAYAKRQFTFWKSLKQQLENAFYGQKLADSAAELKSDARLINLTLLDRDLYISQLSKRLSKHIK